MVLRDQDALVAEQSPDVNSGAYDYWKVSDPVDADTAAGRVTLGDDAAFRTVEVAAGSNVGFPARIEVTIRGTAPGGEFSVGAFAFKVSRVPAYPADTDPKTVKYGYQLGATDEQKLTAGEIDERSRCAREYVT